MRIKLPGRLSFITSTRQITPCDSVKMTKPQTSKVNAQESNRGTLEAGRECKDRESLPPFVRNRFQEAFYLIFKLTLFAK
jgi:hypothetical protein